jgi:hypothetical protein
VYSVATRVAAAFTRESVVFAYHAGSFAVAGALLLVLALVGSVQPAALVAAMALHGLYSLSFLELWSLTQGGYSVRILNAIAQDPSAGESALRHFSAVGAGKKQARLDGLAGLGLVREAAGDVELTGRGRLVSAGLKVMTILTNTQKAG